MSKSKALQTKYKDRYDKLKVAQAAITSLVGSLLFAADAPPWVLYTLLAAQSALAMYLVLTRQNLEASGVVVDDTDEAPRHDRETLPSYKKDQP